MVTCRQMTWTPSATPVVTRKMVDARILA